MANHVKEPGRWWQLEKLWDALFRPEALNSLLVAFHLWKLPLVDDHQIFWTLKLLILLNLVSLWLMWRELVKVQETQFTSCTKTTTVRAISGWLKALLHHVIAGIQFTLHWIQDSLNVNRFSSQRTGWFYFSVTVFQLNFCISQNSYQHWHATSWDLEEDICCHLQWLEELGQLMLAMNMFDVRRVLASYLEEIFPQISVQQHGNSWAKKFLRTMGSLSLVFLWH